MNIFQDILYSFGAVFRKGRPLNAIVDAYHKEMNRIKIIAVAIQLFSIFGAVVGAYIVGMIAEQLNYNIVIPLICTQVIFIVVSYILNMKNGMDAHAVSYKSLGVFHERLFKKLDELAPAYFITQRSGNIAQSAVSDIDLLELYTSHTIPEYLQALVVTPVVLLIMALFHWSLALTILPFLVLAALVPDFLAQKAAIQGEQLKNAEGDINSEVVDGLHGIREILSFEAMDSAKKRLQISQKKYGEMFVDYSKRGGFEKGLSTTIFSSGVLAVVVLGAWLVSTGRMGEAVYPAATVLASMAFVPVTRITTIARELSKVNAAAQRIFDILHAEPSVHEKTTDIPTKALVPRIAFKDVHFRYHKDTPEVLKGISFKVNSGETVALSGASGAGKTTCTHLLLRYWDPDTGTITIGDTNICGVPQYYLRDMIAYVSQDVYLFGISVKENIRIGRADATEDEVMEAARHAYAEDFIQELPDGWDTILGERGTGLSGGQRQRIAIARAFLKNAPILVMDEAVSNLDTESEAAVKLAIEKISKNRTTIIIAHRKYTIDSADRLIRLQKGRVM